MKFIQLNTFSRQIAPRTWSLWFSGIVLGITAIGAILNLTVDPLQIYRPNPYAPLQTSSRYQNAGRIRSLPWNSLIVGTSLSENFRPKLAEELFDNKFMNVSMPGSGIDEQSIILNFACTLREPEIIIWGIDIFSMAKLGGKGRWKEQLPHYLYNQTVWDDAPYLLSRATAENSWAVLKNRLADKPITTDPDLYNNWHAHTQYSSESVWKNYAKCPQLVSTFDCYKLEQFKENFNQNIKPLLKAHGKTDFNLVFLPYALPYFKGLEKIHPGSWDEWKAIKLLMLEMKSSYPNLHIYEFQDRFDWITNYSKYKDIVHFHQDYSDEILRTIKYKKEVTADQVNEWYARLMHEIENMQVPNIQ
ncbi:MAG: hypothetical protein PF904_09305 [Kiritimatiellae bacterium]|jgi:hypothetical protein|nr:hypothetical protein [Kiritimatiellia bacterium]